MSLYVRIENCKPSVIAKAFGRIAGYPIAADGWEDIDRPDFLRKSLEGRPEEFLRGSESDHWRLTSDLADWNKILRALTGSPEEIWKIQARRFAVAGRKKCQDEIAQIESCGAFPAAFKDFAARQLGGGKHARFSFVPGACMRLCMRDKPLFLDLLPLPWVTSLVPVGLRYASRYEALQFLRLLGGFTEIRLMDAAGCHAEVAREGTGVSLARGQGHVAAGKIGHCIELLDKESGRAVAASVFPPYDDVGREIPA